MTSRWAAYRPGVGHESLQEGLELRSARLDDCAEVGRIEHERDGVDEAEARQRCERDLADSTRILLVAAVEGEIMAFGRAGWLEAPAAASTPAAASAPAAPSGWYLLGVVVRDHWRRRGIGLELTQRRLTWISARSSEAFYFANARNRASIDLHAKLGFRELTRDFTVPGASFDGGVGVLFRADLTPGRASSAPDSLRASTNRPAAPHP